MSTQSSMDFHHLPEETIQVIPPVPAIIFEKRSSRLRFLAPGHVIRKYLESISHLAEAQVAASQIFSSKKGSHATRTISFNLRDHRAEESWRQALDVIIPIMQAAALPKESLEALSRLKSASPEELENMAEAILSENYASIDLAAAPFVAAALQVYWTDIASKTKAAAAERCSHLCPVCSSPPVAGVILRGRKLRYLCCSLCATLWYVPRLTCTHCGSTADLTYFTVDGDEAGTKAEACSGCKTYLKLFYLENNPEADAFADDLATLALDLLIADLSYSRSGVNLFLLPETYETGRRLPHAHFRQPKGLA